MSRYWIVICPELYAVGGLWGRWYDQNCVAAGWPPTAYSLEGPTDDSGWAYASDRLKEMRVGDKVVPFLQRWRIGLIGTITEINIKDEQWNPTLGVGEYTPNPTEAELGRRIQVVWETSAMPPPGKVALVPTSERPKRALALHTIEELSTDQFTKLLAVLSSEANWIALKSSLDKGMPDPKVEISPSLSLLERDLQKFIARNLHSIEPGMKAHPEYQLEEFITDVGRIDLLCQDSNSRLVIVELKAGQAGDDALGQVLGYLSWVRENIPNASDARGIIVCQQVSDRLKAGAKLIPGLSLKKFNISFSIENAE